MGRRLVAHPDRAASAIDRPKAEQEIVGELLHLADLPAKHPFVEAPRAGRIVGRELEEGHLSMCHLLASFYPYNDQAPSISTRGNRISWAPTWLPAPGAPQPACSARRGPPLPSPP